VKAELWCVLGGERAGARTTSQVRQPAGWCTRWLTDAGGEAPGGRVERGSGSARLAGTALREQHVMCRGEGGLRARGRRGLVLERLTGCESEDI
jgi:hypothetical protein